MRHPFNPSPLRGASAVPAFVLLGCLVACRGPSPEVAPRAESLLLVTVDTLRPDRLGHSGHPRPTSPVIDRLARRGVVFENAYSAAGWTLPSVATLLTGLPPHEHGATEVGRALRPGLPTLATALAARGFATAAFVSHVLLEPASGLDRGFDLYDDTVLDVGHPHAVATAEALTDRAIAALRELPTPFFLWVHYFDPHFDYLPHAETADFGGRRIDRYDGEIRHVDRHLGRLLDALDARDLTSSTAVVFTADHGEEFGEHGGRFHFTLHQEVVRVPLIVAAPGLEPGRRSEAVGGVDVAGLALHLLGVEALPGAADRDLLGGTDVGPPPPVFLERDRPRGYHQRGVLDSPLKLVVVEESQPAPPGRRGRGPRLPTGVFLWHLGEDPEERENRFDPGDPDAVRMLALLESRFPRGAETSAGPQLDDELRRQLEALGYVP